MLADSEDLARTLHDLRLEQGAEGNSVRATSFDLVSCDGNRPTRLGATAACGNALDAP